VISNLPIGQQVTLQVRALAAQACQQSGIGQAMVGSPVDDVFVPNVFTPNGDGRNDQLMVYATALQSMEFRVYDQWGNEVFRATDPKAAWDGSYRGQRAPVGVYVYALKAVLPDGKVVTKKGSINLLR
ncbi:MAG: gliding motility-associated C-terminal domain-containing protein, partial [Chitinophagaceae bacterium]